MYKVRRNTISKFIKEVYEAMYDAVQEFIKVEALGKVDSPSAKRFTSQGNILTIRI